MPTFNRAAFLPRSVGSVLAQSFQDWELIILNDGGIDRTPEVVAPYLVDSRIRYFAHSNRGVGATRNVGLSLATGRYVTFLDSDDAYRPNHLQSRLDFMSRHPDVDLVQGGLQVMGDIYVVDFDNPSRRISIYDCISGATFFGKREVFRGLGGFAALFNYEDTDFWRRAEKCFVTRKLEMPRTYEYYRHEDSITASALAEQAAQSDERPRLSLDLP